MKRNISPSLLSANFVNLTKDIKTVEDLGVTRLHLDVMDGHFVPNLTIGPDIVRSIRKYTKKLFDVHLMIDPVNKYIPEFAKAGADIITIHEEISEEVLESLS